MLLGLCSTALREKLDKLGLAFFPRIDVFDHSDEVFGEPSLFRAKLHVQIDPDHFSRLVKITLFHGVTFNLPISAAFAA